MKHWAIKIYKAFCFLLLSLFFVFQNCHAQPLRDEVREAAKKVRQDQQEVLSVLDETLMSIRTKFNVKETPLSEKYTDLRNKYNKLAAKADGLRESQASFKELCTNLFSEWKHEANEMKDVKLKNKSIEALAESKLVYDGYAKRLDDAFAKLAPVQQSIKDNVTFIKHRLNAETIQNLDIAVDGLESDIAELVTDMNELLEETQKYIEGMPE